MKAYRVLIKTGEAKSIDSFTDKPFSWFPELKKFFEHFHIKRMEFEIDLEKEPTTRDPEVHRVIFEIQ